MQISNRFLTVSDFLSAPVHKPQPIPPPNPLPISHHSQTHEMPPSLLSRFDKCFAASWLDHNRVVLGTKDNALVIVDAVTGVSETVALPKRNLASPVRARRTQRTPIVTNDTREFYSGDVLTRVSSAPSAHALMRVETSLVTWSEAPAPVAFSLSLGTRSEEGDGDGFSRHSDFSPSDSMDDSMDTGDDELAAPDTANAYAAFDTQTTQFENCGIHAISLNPRGSRLATGGNNPCDVAVFSVADRFDAPQKKSHEKATPAGTLAPSALLVGHRDWVFGLDWIGNNLVASASRDKTVKIWSVPSEVSQYSPPRGNVSGGTSASQSPPRVREITTPVATIRAHLEKVRDVAYAFDAKRLVSLSTDGYLKFTDPATMGVADSKKLRSTKELVCLATDGTHVAVGSQNCVAFVDSRENSSGRITEKKLPNGDCDGVRSLSYGKSGSLLTVGGGGGNVFFFDVTAGAFLPDTRRFGTGGASSRGCFENDDDEDAFSERVVIPFEGTDEKELPSVLELRRGTASGWVNPVDESRDARPATTTTQLTQTQTVNSSPQTRTLSLRLGDGFLDREDDVFREHFAHVDDGWYASRNACYAHAWDATGTRLLVTGGPLAFGLKGCYAGVWR